MDLQKVGNKQKKIVFCWGLEGQGRKYQDPDSDRDPMVRGTDPRIRTKMSRIHNTAIEVF
jgi:hypothetical protein